MKPRRRHSAPAPGRRKRRAGFSLLELMIALGVLAFGLLGVAAAQIQALQQGSRGRHTTAATTIAQNEYERILRMPYSDPQLAATSTWAAAPWITASPPLATGDVAITVLLGDDTTSTELVYNVQYRVSAAASPELRNIDLQVSWNEDIVGTKTIGFTGMIADNDR